MRRFLLLLCVTLPLAGRTQSIADDKQQELLGKKHINVGVSVGKGFRGTYPTTTSISPHIQYFITDGWSVAVEGRLLKANSVYDLTYLGGGLSTRYYFLRGSRFALFSQLGVIYGQSRYHKWDPSDVPASLRAIPNANWQTNAGLGIHYRLRKRWSVEAVAQRSWLQASYLTPDYNRWQFNLGINYRLRYDSIRRANKQ